MIQRRQIVDFILVLGLSLFVFLCCISQTNMGFWEPWETSTLLVAQRMAQFNILESSFWVPQLGDAFVSQPLLQLWSLALLLHVHPEPDAFLLRLPGALVGVLLVLLSFVAMRQASNRRSAWVTVAALLTLPMFVLGGKLIHGDIWLILAVALPNLFYSIACYSDTRRMNRTMFVFCGLSLGISFLSGGLYALAMLGIEAVLFVLFVWRHPHRRAVLEPLRHRYFVMPLYVAFLFCTCVFGTYVTQARYALEGRIPMTLAQINEALDNDRILSIERRHDQIIGRVRESGGENGIEGQKSFILVESQSNLSTNATLIFEQNAAERRTFENYLMWRFQKKVPSRAEQEIPPLDGAFEAALRFFWNHTNRASAPSDTVLVRAHQAVPVFETPMAPTSVAPVLRTDSSTTMDEENRAGFALEKDEIVRVLNDDRESPWIEIQDGNGRRGFAWRDHVDFVDTGTRIQWFSWIDVLLYGLFPWGCFCPILFLCAFARPKKLVIAEAPFVGEFTRPPADESGSRSPLQWLLLSWIIAGIVGLFYGINQGQRDFFAGVIPAAMLFGIALSSFPFWRSIRESLEARLILEGFALGTLALALYAVYREPYRIVRYLLTDPLMSWGVDTSFPMAYVLFCLAFLVLTLISFTSVAEKIQTRMSAWREQHRRPRTDVRTSSSSSLMRVSREDTVRMPYAPALSFIALAVMASGYLYFTFLPSISDNFTETALIHRYFELASQSEPVYLLSGENSQLCMSYRDCDSGYVCESNRCRISIFSSYSLDVAQPISRSEMMRELMPGAAPAFFIVPRDALFDLNQAYRWTFPEGERKNLTVVDAPSSRLYLLGNHSDLPSVNPFEAIFPAEIPQNASVLRPIELGEDIVIEGFRTEHLDFDKAKTLEMTLYYRVRKAPESSESFYFEFDIPGRQFKFNRDLLSGGLDAREIIPGDLVADTVTFYFPLIQRHGVLSVQIGLSGAELKPLTTIEF